MPDETNMADRKAAANFCEAAFACVTRSDHLTQVCHFCDGLATKFGETRRAGIDADRHRRALKVLAMRLRTIDPNWHLYGPSVKNPLTDYASLFDAVQVAGVQA